MRRGATVVLVGAGGNIGSAAVAHLSRMPAIVRLVLVDRDVYEPRNLPAQQFAHRDIGRPKVHVQARRARRIRPDLAVRGVHAPVEQVPLGLLRADLILSGLDSLGSRRSLARAAWRLGVPLLDAGVRTEELMVRVTAYEPAKDAGCLECAWDDRQYALVDRAWPCAPGEAEVPTGGISALGGLVASWLVLAARARLAGDPGVLAPGEERVMDVRSGRVHANRIPRRPECRFDHAVWRIEPAPAPVDRLALGTFLHGDEGSLSLRVEGDAFARRLVCPRPGCGGRRSVLRLEGRIPASLRSCASCGARMVVPAFHRFESLRESDLSPMLLDRPVSCAGVRPEDVITVSTQADERHYEFVMD